MSDQFHSQYELRDTTMRSGGSAWAWILPALLAGGIILVLAFFGWRGGTPDAAHPGGSGEVAPAAPAPAQPVQPAPAD